MAWSCGLVTFTIRLSCTWSVRLQPTPQYGQIVSVVSCRVLVPGALGAHRPLGAGHERPGRAHGDAIPAVDARRLGQGDVVLGGDVGVEAPPGHRDGERVLPLLAAGVHALVAEDALGVVADVELVVVLHRLLDGGGIGAEPIRLRAVVLDPARGRGSGGEVHRRGQQLQHQPPRPLDPVGRGLDDHAILGLARAGRYQHAGALQLHDADAAGVGRLDRRAVAQRRRLDAGGPAGRQQRRRPRRR